MTAWLTGLSTRDSILLFSHVMGFITNSGDDIEYFQLGVALDYYGKTSCSHELRQTDIGLSTIGYEIGDYYQPSPLSEEDNKRINEQVKQSEKDKSKKDNK